MKLWRVLALALSIFCTNLIGIDSAQAATFSCGSGGTYTVVSGHITESLNCSGTLTIDSSVTAIDSDAFARSKFFRTPTFRFVSQNPRITVLTIPSSVLSIGARAFQGMSTLTSITIANSITTIGDSAFYGDNNVTEFNLGSGTYIDYDAFQAFTYISKFALPEGVTQINQGVFVDWPSVTTFTLPSTLTNLGWMALRGMRSLRSINIPANLSTINDPFGVISSSPLLAPYFCSTTGASNTASVNTYFANLIEANTLAGRCANSFDAPIITSVTNPSSTSATINFTPPSNYGAGTQISSYAVVAFPGGKRATVSGGSSRSITIGSLTPGIDYTFEVTAINDESPSITSPPSARSAPVTCCTASATVPDAPTIGAATALSPTSANVSFTAPISNGGEAIDTYTVTSSPGSITAQILQSGSGSITLNGLTPSTTYTFRVTAANSVGTSSVSGATDFLKMPASQAEIDAAAEAAKKAAEAKREAEKQAARIEILKSYSDSKVPVFELFAIADIYGVTENNFSVVNGEILSMNASDRSEIRIVEKISKKYLILDSISAGGKFPQFFAKDLSSVGIIPEQNQVRVTYVLRNLPANQRDDYAKIMSAIDSELSLIKRRNDRLAAIIILIRNRQSA
jgi:hypothetical protein